MAQPGDPVNDFIEFVKVWGGVLSNYLEAVIMYDSRRRREYTMEDGSGKDITMSKTFFANLSKPSLAT